jgi:hypothetical protein
MRTVHKFPFRDTSPITAPGRDPRVVHVGIDPSGDPLMPCVWVEYDPDWWDTTITLSFIGTGHPVPDNATHVGSVAIPAGLVWHVYQENQ